MSGSRSAPPQRFLRCLRRGNSRPCRRSITTEWDPMESVNWDPSNDCRRATPRYSKCRSVRRWVEDRACLKTLILLCGEGRGGGGQSLGGGGMKSLGRGGPVFGRQEEEGGLWLLTIITDLNSTNTFGIGLRHACERGAWVNDPHPAELARPMSHETKARIRCL